MRSEKRQALKDLLNGKEKISSFSLGNQVDLSRFTLEEIDYLLFVLRQAVPLPHEEQVLQRVIQKMKPDPTLSKWSEEQLDREIEQLVAEIGPLRQFTPQESLTLSQSILTKVQR